MVRADRFAELTSTLSARDNSLYVTFGVVRNDYKTMTKTKTVQIAYRLVLGEHTCCEVVFVRFLCHFHVVYLALLWRCDC